MKSGKQRRAELDAKRQARAAREAAEVVSAAREAGERAAALGMAVNRAALAPHNSYGEPDFVTRGFYADEPFECVDCGKAEVWRAGQQKWWYEVAKGDVFTTARRCRECRRRERARRSEARRVHQEGVARKQRRHAETGAE
ncbi:MAG: zinc-ribbon domain-containing protein [Gemmataceae bacterium]|nr:zinc-ribbon domain-containing protein [Gemmataceae bacterium]